MLRLTRDLPSQVSQHSRRLGARRVSGGASSCSLSSSLRCSSSSSLLMRSSVSPSLTQRTCLDIRRPFSSLNIEEAVNKNEEGGQTRKHKQEKTNTQLEQEYLGDELSLNIVNMPEVIAPDVSKKEKQTELGKEIATTINARGPMPFARFWELCMQHPRYGYYMTKDPIGRDGDFITTPEMFSGFGDALAIWCVYTWEQMGRPQKVRIIEFGPGLGSVTKAIMNLARKESLGHFRQAMQIHLVESSKRLRWKQKEALRLGHVRKFKMKVEKPLYATSHAGMGPQHKGVVSAEESESVEEALADLDRQEKAGGIVAATGIKKGGTTNIIRPEDARSAEQEILVQTEDPETRRKNEEKKLPRKPTSQERFTPKGPVLAPDDPVLKQPKNTHDHGMVQIEKMFGDLTPTAAKGIRGTDYYGNPSQEVKDEIPPFDWSLLKPKAVEVPKGAMAYLSGKKTRDWYEEKGRIEVDLAFADKALQRDYPAKPKEEESKREREARLSSMSVQTGMDPSKIDRMEEEKIKQSKLNVDQMLNFDDLEAQTVDEEEDVWQARTRDGILVSWHDSLYTIEDCPALFIAHEFFDALPVSHFEYKSIGWVETLVANDLKEDSPLHFELTRGNSTSFAGALLDHQFRQRKEQPPIGAQLSMSPLGNSIAADMGKWVVRNGGAGFIVDYGDEHPPAWTVQGARKHKPTHVLSMPGDTDISAHVNFTHLKQALINGVGKTSKDLKREKEKEEAEKDGGTLMRTEDEIVDEMACRVFGPVTQSYFLQGCGIVHRFRDYLKILEKDESVSEEQRTQFIKTFGTLMDVDGLGSHFKVLGFANPTLGTLLGFREPISAKKAKVDEYGIPVYKKTTIPKTFKPGYDNDEIKQ